MSGVAGLLIPFTIRLVVSYIIMRIMYSWILYIRRYFIKKDKLKSVKAKKIMSTDKWWSDDSLGERSGSAVYEYYVNGKKYRKTLYYKGHVTVSMPFEETLYYRNNPKNVFRNNRLVTEESEKICMFIIAVVYAIFMTLLVRTLKMIAGLG